MTNEKTIDQLAREWLGEFNSWEAQLNVQDSIKMYGTNGFWPQVRIAWSKLTYDPPVEPEHIRQQRLWMNSKIRIQDQPFVWPHWYSQNIVRIEDLLNEEGNFRDRIELSSLYDFPIMFTEYLGLIQAIPNEWKESVKNSPVKG